MEQTKKCPYCGEEIRAEAKKCRYCGEWLDREENMTEKGMITCPICGEDIEKGIKVCPYCHEKIEVSQPLEIKNRDNLGKEKDDEPSAKFIGADDNSSKVKWKRMIYKYWGLFGIIFIIIIAVIIGYNNFSLNSNNKLAADTISSVADTTTCEEITDLPKEVLLDNSSESHCIYYVNDTCCIKYDTQSKKSTYIMNISSGSLLSSQLKDLDGEDLIVFSIAAKKVDSTKRYIVFALDRESNGMESYDFVQYDTRSGDYKYIARSRGIYKDSSNFFDGDNIIVLDTEPINKDTSCTADYRYKTRKSYYDFEGNLLYNKPWRKL